MEEAGQFEQGLTRMAWKPAQMEYVRKLFSEMLPHFQSRYPRLRFTYSLTSFFKEVRSMGLQLFDVLELHLWIHSPRFDNRTGFNKLTKDRGERDYKDYAGRIAAALDTVGPMLVKEMDSKCAFAKSWSEEIAAPVVTTEAWGPWWHMDHPDLDWGWLRDWCEQCMNWPPSTSSGASRRGTTRIPIGRIGPTWRGIAKSTSASCKADEHTSPPMNPTIIRLLIGALAIAIPAGHAAEPLSVSGIYPHLTVFNSDPKREKPEMECGLGAAVPWAGKLWSTTYTSHALGRGNDKLFAILPDMSLEIRPESVGGTSACRMIHRESKQLFIASYAIDEAGKVRVIPRDKLPGRLTALARHLTDPENKVLYLTQEGAVYEVDVHSLAVTELFKKPLPGWHYKGAWTAQGRFFVAANGEEPAPSPFWKVDYTSAATKFETEKLTWQYLQTPYQPLATPRSTGQTLWKGISEDIGNLGEWDGKTWRILSRRQHLDITGPGGLTGATSDDEPVWALGWDLRSAFIKVREKSGTWTTYRLPKSSYTADGVHGSNTEWPRICDVGDGPRLMFLHNGLYELPVGFRDGHSAGLRHLASTLVTVTDMTKWNGKLVFSQQATSVHGIPSQCPASRTRTCSSSSAATCRRGGRPKLAAACGWRMR